MRRWREILSENSSYKLVALVVALVLWLTLQGRRDVVLSREVELQVLMAPHMAVTNPIPQTLRVELSGARLALKRVAEGMGPATVDLRHVAPGRQVVTLTRDNFTVPVGAKVLSIQPNEFLAVVVEVQGKKSNPSVEK